MIIQNRGYIFLRSGILLCMLLLWDVVVLGQRASVTTTGKRNPLWYVLLAIGLFAMYKLFTYITRRVCGTCDNLTESADIDEIYIELLTIEEENKQREKEKALAEKTKHARDESLNFLLENELNNKNGTSPSPIKNPRKEEKISSPMQTPSTVRSNQLHIEIQENTPKNAKKIESEEDEEEKEDMWKLWNKHRTDDPNNPSLKVHKPNNTQPPATTTTIHKTTSQSMLMPLSSNNPGTTGLKVRPLPPPLPLPKPANDGVATKSYEISVPINPQNYTSNQSVSSVSLSSKQASASGWQATREVNAVGSVEHQADVRRAISKLHPTSTVKIENENMIRRPRPPATAPPPRAIVSLPRPITSQIPSQQPRPPPLGAGHQMNSQAAMITNGNQALTRRPAPPPNPPPRHILGRPLFNCNSNSNHSQVNVTQIKNPMQQPLSMMMRPAAMKND